MILTSKNVEIRLFVIEQGRQRPWVARLLNEKKHQSNWKKKKNSVHDRQTNWWMNGLTDRQIDKQTYGQNRFIKYGIASTVKIWLDLMFLKKK